MRDLNGIKNHLMTKSEFTYSPRDMLRINHRGRGGATSIPAPPYPVPPSRASTVVDKCRIWDRMTSETFGRGKGRGNL